MFTQKGKKKERISCCNGKYEFVETDSDSEKEDMEEEKREIIALYED
jgi:hypothetical protein